MQTLCLFASYPGQNGQPVVGARLCCSDIHVASHPVRTSRECLRKWKTRYLATGDTVADLAKSKPEADMSEIVTGATADHIGQIACKK